MTSLARETFTGPALASFIVYSDCQMPLTASNSFITSFPLLQSSSTPQLPLPNIDNPPKHHNATMTPKPQENDSLNKTCIRCTDAATNPCEGCKGISYCSPECQQADWPSHKLLCESFKDFAQPPPSPDMVRIIIFHPDEKEPRFAWAPTSGPNVKDAGLLDRYGDQMDYFRSTNKNAWTGEDLGYHVFIHYDDNFIGSYKGRNPAIVSSTQGMDYVEWSGPMTVHCRPSMDSRPGRTDTAKLIHMNLQAFAHVVGYLIVRENDSFMRWVQERPKVNCVKVACKGDRDNGVPSHQLVRVPRSHPVFQHGHGGSLSQVSNVSLPFTSTPPMSPSLVQAAMLTPNSQLVFEPLLTWKYPSSQPSFKNQHITFMHIGCNPDIRSNDEPNRASFGIAPMKYQDGVGTQLVASAAMKNLSAEAVEAFGDFCQWHLMPYTQRYMEETDDEVAPTASVKAKARNQVMGQMTNAKWTEYFAQWKAEKQDASAAEARGTHPYTLQKASSGVERMGLTEHDSDRLRYVLCGSLEQYLRKLDLSDD